jgi:hypothetical protein
LWSGIVWPLALFKNLNGIVCFMSTTSTSDQAPVRWKISTGVRHGGPFSRERLRALVDAGRVPPGAFVRDVDDLSDWTEVQTLHWLVEEPELAHVRWCPECDSRVLLATDGVKKTRRCPHCRAPVFFVDYLHESEDLELSPLPPDPWGKFQWLAVAAALIACSGGAFAILSLLWNPVLSVLLAFVFLVAGGALFSLTFRYRETLSRFLTRQRQLEQLINERTQLLLDRTTNLRGLQRSLTEIRIRLESDIEREFEDQRRVLQRQQESAADSVNAVHRMAERFLDETRKWWTSKLRSDNYQATKDRLQKAIDFCRRSGYSVPSKKEREVFRQLQADYEEVLRREAEKEQQQKIREQIREEARVAREYKRELERVERERQMIEQAIAAAMKKAGAEHSAEIDALRRKLAEAEERGRRTQAQAELTKAGHVYVISNLGAFGEHVYKVGMTRRLIPADRVRELGDASVPFPFDVHMMIASDNAPSLETNLHRALHRYRVNKVNFRKEFFRVDLDSIRQIVEANHGIVEFQAAPEASEYRQTLEISDTDFEYLAQANAAADLDDPMEDEDLDGGDGDGF